MPTRLSIWGASRSLAVRLRPQTQNQRPSIAVLARQYAGDAGPPSTPPPDSTNPAGPYGAAIPRIPASMMPPGQLPPISQEELEMRARTPNESAVQQQQKAAHGLKPFKREEFTGLKFEEPPMPTDRLPRAQYHMRYRYDEGITQITKLLMRDGKLSKAQNEMAMVLSHLRTSPAPKINPQRPLLPGSPPPEHLPLNPNLYLMLAIDSVAPLIRIRGYTGLGGGGKALEVPVPISKRARRRVAWQWIMDTVNKKPSMGSGKKMLATKIGEEIVAVVEGRSGVWDKRGQLHKTGTSVRANLNSPALVKRRL